MTSASTVKTIPSASGTIVEIRDAIAAGRTTVGDQISACRANIEATNTQLAAFNVIAGEQVGSVDPVLPLAGISVGVKDLYDTAGMVTSYGSPIFRNHVPAADAALVTRLKALGAFVAGKTVTTEFAWRQAGPTVNPWNHVHTPGGSSSGSAAAVAAGLVPLATGTQTFGSVIRPAAFCGVIGFKPTYGLLPLDGVQPLSPTLDHAGLFARTVSDIAYTFNLLTGQTSPADTPARSPRLRLVRGPFWDQASPTQQKIVEEAAEEFARLGASVTERELPASFDAAAEIAEIILCKEAAEIYGPLVQKHPDLVSTHIKELVVRGETMSDGDHDVALASRERLQREFQQEMSGYDAILTVPALGEAPLLTEGTGNAGPCIAWTLLGVPAIALPRSTGTGSLPLGIQLVGTAGGDGSLLAAATWCAVKGHSGYS